MNSRARFPHPILYAVMLVLAASAIFFRSDQALAASIPLPAGDVGLPSPGECDTIDVAGSAYIEGINCRIVPIGGYPRTYIVYIPANLQSPAPVVYQFHGTGGDGYGFHSNSGWLEKADAEGLILVSMSSLKYCQQGYDCEHGGSEGWKSKWHHYAFQIDAADYNLQIKPDDYPAGASWPANDVKFTQAVVADVKRTGSAWNVDSDRMFATGFSNGASFVAQLAVELADELAAVGYSSGGLIDGSNPDEPAAYIPVFALFGTHERGVISQADTNGQPIPLDPDEFLADAGLQSYFIFPHLDGFEHEYDPLNPTPDWTLKENHYTVVNWQSGPAKHLFQLGVLEGLQHTYPSGMEPRNPYGFVAADIFWEFFEAVSQ